MAVSGGFPEQYFEYGPGIRRERARVAPERRRQSMPYRLPGPPIVKGGTPREARREKRTPKQVDPCDRLIGVTASSRRDTS